MLYDEQRKCVYVCVCLFLVLMITMCCFPALLDSPQVLIAEEEKIIVEETRGNQVVVEEKWVQYSPSS